MARVRNLFGMGIVMIVAALMFGFMPSLGKVAAADTAPLNFAFKGTVTRGESAGTVLEGKLSLTPMAGGMLEGGLDIGDAVVPVTGQLAGTNISVTFDLGDGVYIFGIGTANEDLVFRGPFVGPASGDQGRWIAKPITTVQLDFTGTVLEGPTAGGVVAGPLTLHVQPNGRFTGMLDAGELKPSASGRIFEVDGETRIRIVFQAEGLSAIGKGVLQADGSWFGTFRSPDTGDKGEWTATPAAE